MIVPNKAITYQDSVLSKLPEIILTLQHGQIPAFSLYQKVQSSFSSLSQFIIALDTLFVLEMISIESGEIKLC